MNRVERSTVFAAGNPLNQIESLVNPTAVSRQSEKPAVQVKRRNRDIAELSADRDQSISGTAVSDLFDILSRDYPGITFLAERSGGTHPGGARDISQIAAGLGRGTYVVVSREFLERMGRSREDFEACKSALTEALRGLSAAGKDTVSQGVYLGESKAVSWHVSAQPGADAAKKMAEALKKKKTEVSSKSPSAGIQPPTESDYRRKTVVSYSTMNHFNGLARAGSKGEVKRVMSDVHRSISQLRLAAVYGDEKERVKAGRTMRSLQKLLARGSRKIRRFDQEELLRVRKKHAQEERKEKRVRQIKLELKKRRSARKGADYRLVREGIADTYMILGEKRGRKDYELERMERSADLYAGMADVGGGTAGGGEFAAAEVVVSPEATF